jgi:hypothetical protein
MGQFVDVVVNGNLRELFGKAFEKVCQNGIRFEVARSKFGLHGRDVLLEQACARLSIANAIEAPVRGCAVEPCCERALSRKGIGRVEKHEKDLLNGFVGIALIAKKRARPSKDGGGASPVGIVDGERVRLVQWGLRREELGIV